MQPSALTEEEHRVLSEGPSGPIDYEIVRRLVDYGYTDSKIRLSKMRDSYGEVLGVAWLGPNTTGKVVLEGRTFVEWEKANQPEPFKREEDQIHSDSFGKKVKKAVSSFVARVVSEYAEQLIVAALMAITGVYVFIHFGIHIQ